MSDQHTSAWNQDRQPNQPAVPPAQPVPPYQPPAQASSSAPEPYQVAQPYQQTPQPYQQVQPYQQAAQPYQQPYGAYPAQAYAPAAPNSGAAIASLVCGLAGLVLAWLGVPVLASIAAVITGHMALKQIRQRPGLGGKGMAITGLILGYVAIALWVLAIVAGLIAFFALGAFTLPFLFAG